MKKMILRAIAASCIAAFAFIFVSCNKELSPADKTAPVFLNATFPTMVTPDQDVHVSILVFCDFGLQDVSIHYQLNGQQELVTSLITYPDADTSTAYEGILPKQPLGTKVTFWIVAHSVPLVQGQTDKFSYTVQAPTEVNPTNPNPTPAN